MDCGKVFSIDEYVNDMNEESWDKISCRPCDRV
jgi:hypothetical protein